MENFIIDIDGTVLNGEIEINNSSEFIKKLQKKEINFLLATNSIKSHDEQIKRLKKAGITVTKKIIYTPIDSINKYIQDNNVLNAMIIGSDSEINQIHTNNSFKNPEIIILLDFEKNNTSYKDLQLIVDKAEEGCEIITASGSPYYLINGKKQLDTGSFVNLLESVLNRKIAVLGKPSKQYFLNAKSYLCKNNEIVVMIGDDWKTDIYGAKKAGFNTILIKSGKYQSGDEKKESPDSLINDLLEIKI